MMTRIKESDIQKAILQYLRMSGHFCWRNNTGMFFGQHKGKKWAFKAGVKGSSDIVGIAKNGLGIAIEVKRWDAPATEDQLVFIEEFRKRGGYAFVANSVDEVISQGL